MGFHAFGAEGPYRGNLMTHRLRFNPHLHTSETFRMMVDALETDVGELPTLGVLPAAPDETPPRFEPDAKQVEQARVILRRCAKAEGYKPLILLNANCGDLLPLRR